MTRQCAGYALRAFGLLFLVLVVATRSLAQWPPSDDFSTNQIAAMKEFVSYDEWGGETKTNYTTTITNWTPSFAGVGVTNVEQWISRSYTNATEGIEVATTYTFSPTNNLAVQWYATTKMYPAVSDAHEMMVVRFMQSSYPAFTNGTSVGIDIGDICFVNEGLGNIPSRAVFFCRNNVFAEVGTKQTESCDSDCVAIAEELDAQLLDMSTE